MSTSVSRSPRNFIAGALHELPRSGIRDFFDIVSSMSDVISLGVGEPGFDTPWHIREAAVFALEKGATGYTSNRGLLKLRGAISQYVARTFGLAYDPKEEILVTVGVSEALDLALRAIIDPGDEILYHEPCYVSYGPLIRLCHGVPVAIPTGADQSFRLTADAVRARLTPRSKALILNFPNNPTGAALSPQDLRDLAALAVEHDLLVITDEIYAELSYDDEPLSIASLPGMKERTIFLHGFSKAWAMTGFRIGYACSPPELSEAMMKVHQYTMLCAPILSQEAAVEALRTPESDIATMKSAYRTHRNFIHSALEEMGIPCCRPAGAFYAFPSIAGFGMGAKDFAVQLLQEERVAVVPGTAFGPSGEGFIRCSYATALDDIKTAMQRLNAFLQRHGR